MFILGAAFSVPLAVFCKDLTYPTSESIQLFHSEHPMERYQLEVRYTCTTCATSAT